MLAPFSLRVQLEYMMRRHLKFMSDRECNSARAPAALEKDILRHAFWRVDPQRTGAVSIQQFLQVGLGQAARLGLGLGTRMAVEVAGGWCMAAWGIAVARGWMEF